MHELTLKAVLDLERALDLGQAPPDDVRATVLCWQLAEKTGELIAREGAMEAAERLLRSTIS